MLKYIHLQSFSISAMTNNYRDGGLMTPGQQPGQPGTNPVIRMLDMSGGPQPGYTSQVVPQID